LGVAALVLGGGGLMVGLVVAPPVPVPPGPVPPVVPVPMLPPVVPVAPLVAPPAPAANALPDDTAKPRSSIKAGPAINVVLRIIDNSIFFGFSEAICRGK